MCIEGWALEFCCLSSMHTDDSIFPALDNLVGSQSECVWLSFSMLFRVFHEYVFIVGEGSFPVNGDPIERLTPSSTYIKVFMPKNLDFINTIEKRCFSMAPMIISWIENLLSSICSLPLLMPRLFFIFLINLFGKFFETLALLLDQFLSQCLVMFVFVWWTHKVHLEFISEIIFWLLLLVMGAMLMMFMRVIGLMVLSFWTWMVALVLMMMLFLMMSEMRVMHFRFNLVLVLILKFTLLNFVVFPLLLQVINKSIGSLQGWLG